MEITLYIIEMLMVLCCAIIIWTDNDKAIHKVSSAVFYILSFLFIIFSFICIGQKMDPNQHINDYLNGKIVPKTTIIEEDTTIIWIYQRK